MFFKLLLKIIRKRMQKGESISGLVVGDRMISSLLRIKKTRIDRGVDRSLSPDISCK